VVSAAKVQPLHAFQVFAEFLLEPASVFTSASASVRTGYADAAGKPISASGSKFSSVTRGGNAAHRVVDFMPSCVGIPGLCEDRRIYRRRGRRSRNGGMIEALNTIVVGYRKDFSNSSSR
jgi:hypothetical protein